MNGANDNLISEADVLPFNGRAVVHNGRVFSAGMVFGFPEYEDLE